jgi:hypothetical protein
MPNEVRTYLGKVRTGCEPITGAAVRVMWEPRQRALGCSVGRSSNTVHPGALACAHTAWPAARTPMNTSERAKCLHIRTWTLHTHVGFQEEGLAVSFFYLVR